MEMLSRAVDSDRVASDAGNRIHGNQHRRDAQPEKPAALHTEEPNPALGVIDHQIINGARVLGAMWQPNVEPGTGPDTPRVGVTPPRS